MFLVPPSRERIISFELFRERSLPPLNETSKGKDDLVLTRAERGYNREFTKSASPSPYIYIFSVLHANDPKKQPFLWKSAHGYCRN